MSARIATSPPPVPDGVTWTGSFISGAAAAAPLVVGLIPFGMLVGTAVAASDDVLAAWTGTLLIYSGSAQLTLLHLLHDGATVWAAVLTAVLINARLAVFSTSLAPLWRGTALRWKLLAAATVVEPTWAVAEQRRRATTTAADVRRHYAGGVVVVTVGWLAAVSVGALAGRLGGLAPHLAVAVPLCLVPLAVPHLRLPGGVAAVLAAAVTAVAARGLVPGAEVLLPMAAAALAGTLAGRRRP